MNKEEMIEATILSHRNLFSSNALDPSFSEQEVCRELVPWRVVRVTLTDKTMLQSSAYVFVQNSGLSSAQFFVFEAMARKGVSLPIDKLYFFAATYMGDFDLQPLGELPLPTSAPIPPNKNVALMLFLSLAHSKADGKHCLRS